MRKEYRKKIVGYGTLGAAITSLFLPFGALIAGGYLAEGILANNYINDYYPDDNPIERKKEDGFFYGFYKDINKFYNGIKNIYNGIKNSFNSSKCEDSGSAQNNTLEGKVEDVA